MCFIFGRLLTVRKKVQVVCLLFTLIRMEKIYINLYKLIKIPKCIVLFSKMVNDQMTLFNLKVNYIRIHYSSTRNITKQLIVVSFK